MRGSPHYQSRCIRCKSHFLSGWRRPGCQRCRYGPRPGDRRALISQELRLEWPRRRLPRTLGIVIVRNGCAEDRHHAVADVPYYATAILLNGAIGTVEELLQQGVNLFGVELLTPFRGAGEIGEQYRHLPTVTLRVD